MKTHTLCVTTALLAGLATGFSPGFACHDGSPLVLDLNSDGIHTTDVFEPVRFDLDGDGVSESIAWTRRWTEEGLLWLDLNRSGSVDGGPELFGDATMLPDGEKAEHSFEALAVYDSADFGGNGDGLISERDLIWEDLRLWVDRNHDGISQAAEIANLRRYRIVAISLQYAESNEVDGNGNRHRYQGSFVSRVVRAYGPPYLQAQAAHDVFFRIAHE